MCAIFTSLKDSSGLFYLFLRSSLGWLMGGSPPVTPGPLFPGRPLCSLRPPAVLPAFCCWERGQGGPLGFAAGEDRDFHKRTGCRATDGMAAFHSPQSLRPPRGSPQSPRPGESAPGAVRGFGGHTGRAGAESTGAVPASAPLTVCPVNPSIVFFTKTWGFAFIYLLKKKKN